MKGDDTASEATLAETMAPQPGPGSRLAKARAAANMTVEEVAANLNLTLGVVEALERDETEALPAPVFVRGYIKNYARLVGLRGDELVAHYESVRTPDVPLELRPRPASEAPRVHRGISPRALLIALAVAIGVGLAAWWWSQGGRLDIGQLTGSATPSPAPAALPRVAVPATPVFPEPAPRPLSDPLPTERSEPATATLQGAPASQLGTASETPMPPAGEPSAALPTASEPAGVPAPVTEPVPVAVPAPAPVPAAPASHTLSLALSDDVWVEVVDGQGTRLVFDVLRAGTRREISGKGPFLLLFGKAGAVRVELDGRRVDHAAFESKGIARFVLDDQNGEIVTRAP